MCAHKTRRMDIMLVNGTEMSESEVRAYVNELKKLLRIAVKELDKFTFGNCSGCLHRSSCSSSLDCDYRWEFADKAERLLK